MRPLIALYFYLLSSGLAASQAVEQVHDSSAIELAASNYPPYHAKYLPHGGFITEIVSRAFAAKSYKVKVDFYTANQAFDITKFNFVDGIFMISHDNKYDKDFYFSKPIIYINLNLLGLKTNHKLAAEYLDNTQLKVLNIVTGKDYVLPEILQDDSLNIQTTLDDKSAILLLLAGKVDLVLLDESLSRDLLASDFKDSQAKMFFWPGKSLASVAKYLAVARNHPNAKKIIFAFNYGLDVIKDNGQYDKIINAAYTKN